MANINLGHVVGEKGDPAKVNGYNTITIQGGTNIEIEQEEDVLTINNTYDDSEIQGQIEDIKEDKQDNLIAGDNITIEDNVISAIKGVTITVQDGKLIIDGGN